MHNETYRHQCEVRWLIKKRINDNSWKNVEKYLNKPAVAKRAPQLKIDIKEQWTLGNKGNHNEWIIAKD
jgi:hypothetical protein